MACSRQYRWLGVESESKVDHAPTNLVEINDNLEPNGHTLIYPRKRKGVIAAPRKSSLMQPRSCWRAPVAAVAVKFFGTKPLVNKNPSTAMLSFTAKGTPKRGYRSSNFSRSSRLSGSGPSKCFYRSEASPNKSARPFIRFSSAASPASRSIHLLPKLAKTNARLQHPDPLKI